MRNDAEANVAAVKLQQSELPAQIAVRFKAGRPAPSILDDKLDALQSTLTELREELTVVPTEQVMMTKLPPLDKSAIADLITAVFEEVGEAGSHKMTSCFRCCDCW